MKVVLKYIIVAVVLMLYLMHFSFIIGEPIEFINPFEYFAQDELVTLESYIFLMLYTAIPIISYFIGRTQITNRTLIMMLLLGVILIIISRMSIILLIALGIIVSKAIEKIIKSHAQMLYVTISMLLITTLIFVIVMPSLILNGTKETFLDVNAFQTYIGTYNESNFIHITKLNLQLFVQHIGLYSVLLCFIVVPSMLLGKVNVKQFKLPLAIIFLTIGVAIKLLIFIVSHNGTQSLIIINGSLFIGLGIALLIDNGKRLNLQDIVITTLYIAVCEVILVITFTGYIGMFPAESLNILFSKSVVITSIMSVIYVLLMVLINKKYNKFKKI